VNASKPLLKAAALTSSLLLVGTFIGCRTGAIRPYSKPTPQPAESLTTPASPQQEAPAASPSKPPLVMPSTKSAGILTPAEVTFFPAGSLPPATDVPSAQPSGEPPTSSGGLPALPTFGNPAAVFGGTKAPIVPLITTGK
jgi:hypothetical protein